MIKLTIEKEGKVICVIVKEKDKKNKEYIWLLWKEIVKSLDKEEDHKKLREKVLKEYHIDIDKK